MRTVRDVLREADPVLREPDLLESESEQLRRALLGRAETAPMRGRPSFRVSFSAVAVAAVIVAALLGVVQFWPGAADLQAAVRFEVRLAEEQPGPGLRGSKVVGTERVVYLHPQPIASNGDIVRTAVAEDDRPGRSHVIVEFSRAAADRMRRVTGEHVGRPVAILVDGEVIVAPIVRTPISDSAVITGEYTRAEAERIARGIRVR